MKESEVEWHSWPTHRTGGQHVARNTAGVLAVHAPTGIAVVIDEERSMLRNKVKAMKRLSVLVDSTDVGSDEWGTA